MDADFWLQRWQQGQIGFHQEEIHDRLQSLWQSRGGGGRVFVPLCGKSLDMLWLREQGYELVGVELSPLAVEAFFRENAIPARRSRIADDMELWQAPGYELYCGDFFRLPAGALAGVTGVYDRAALVALPPAMRQAYARALVELLPQQAEIFLITLEYDTALMDGPPFSVTADEVHTLYQQHYRVDCLEQREVIDDSPHLRAKGIESLLEKIWRLYP